MTTTDREVEIWLSRDEASEVEYSAYWNDERQERGKAFNVRDGDFNRMEAYVDEVGLVADLESCLSLLDRVFGWTLQGRGIDLAAGTLWAAPLLLRDGVDRLYCLELSRHRLFDLGERVLDHYRIARERAVLAYGSFYQLGLDDLSLDFAFLSQAFHHAERPVELLQEIDRVLRPGGVVIIIGEHRIRPRDRMVHMAKAAITLVTPSSVHQRLISRPVEVKRAFRPLGAELAPPDPVLGDHLYSMREYEAMFRRFGFEPRHVQRRGAQYQGFVLRKPG